MPPTENNDTVTELPVIPGVGGFVSVNNTPHEAQILGTDLPHIRHAVAVTEENGLEVEAIETEDLRSNPHRVAGTRIVSELSSFLAEIERRPLTPNEGTLWGNADRGQIHAIYNEHSSDGTVAGWRDDQLQLKLKADADWSRWHEISGKYYSQVEFGDLVEDLLHTVESPDQAELLEVIDSIRASSSGEFNSAIERANGGQKVTYNNEVATKAGRTGQLEVPQIIQLRLVPWEGHDTAYTVDAYFRIRINNGHLQLAVKLKPTRRLVREAWEDVTNKVTAATSTPVYAQP